MVVHVFTSCLDHHKTVNRTQNAWPGIYLCQWLQSYHVWYAIGKLNLYGTFQEFKMLCVLAVRQLNGQGLWARQLCAKPPSFCRESSSNILALHFPLLSWRSQPHIRSSGPVRSLLEHICRSRLILEGLILWLEFVNVSWSRITAQLDHQFAVSFPLWTSVAMQYRLASVAIQYRFPYELECMVTQIVAATTGRIVDQKTQNPCAIPKVDSNAGKVFAVQCGIWCRNLLVSSKRNTGSGAIVLNMPVVDISSIIDSCWKYVKCNLICTICKICKIVNNM